MLVERGLRYGCLRALEDGDVEGMLEWMHDDGIASVFQADFKSMTEADALAFVESTYGESDSLHFAIVDEGDEYMGTVSLKDVDLRNMSAEYAISTRRRAHGTGLAAKATRDVLCYAFNELGLHRVYLNVWTGNPRARRFYEKFGFAFEGTSRDGLLVGGKFRDLDWFAVLAADFAE